MYVCMFQCSLLILLKFRTFCQFAPLDTPVAVDRFLGYWKPNAIIIMENELWPNLIMSAALLRVI